MARRPRPQDRAGPGRAARPVTPNVGACPPGQAGHPERRCLSPPAVAGERSELAEAVVGRLVEPGVDAARGVGLRRASRDDLQAEGLGRTARLARRTRQPARKSCPPAPPIAAMRWAACRRSRSPTAGAVREAAPLCGLPLVPVATGYMLAPTRRRVSSSACTSTSRWSAGSVATAPSSLFFCVGLQERQQGRVEASCSQRAAELPP